MAAIFPGLLSGSDPGSSSGDGGGSGSGRGGIGVGSSGRGCGGCWGMAPSTDAYGENHTAKRVPDGCSSNARLHIRKHERGSRINPPGSPFLQLGSHNSTNERHLPARSAWHQHWAGAQLLHAGTRLATGKPEAPMTWEDEGGALPPACSPWRACDSGFPRQP